LKGKKKREKVKAHKRVGPHEVEFIFRGYDVGGNYISCKSVLKDPLKKIIAMQNLIIARALYCLTHCSPSAPVGY
jgi:hypothetical protein